MPRSILPATVAGLLALAAFAPAHAVVRTEHYPGAGVCDAATSVDADTLRERAYGLVNVGGNTAYVTCALNGHGQGASTISGFGAQSVTVYFTNIVSGSVRTASCTAGEALSATAGGATRSANVYAGQGIQTSVRFNSADIGQTYGAWRTPVLTCALPNGVAIEGIWYVFND